MSFSSVEGLGIGSHSYLLFSGNDDGIPTGQTVTLVSNVLAQGAWVFTARINVYAGTGIQPLNLFTVKALAYNGENIIAKYKIEGQANDDICLTAILFSNGVDPFSLEVSTANTTTLETSQSWAYSDGRVDFVRISDVIFE